MRDAAQPHQPAAKPKLLSILRRVATPSLMLAVALTGCDLNLGGQSGLASYNCTKVCFAALDLSVTHKDANGVFDLPADFRGATSDLLVVPLSCDVTCANSGNPGLVANYLALSDQATGWYIRAGYETVGGDNEYFVQYYLPDITNNPNPTLYLTSTRINPGFAGSAPYVAFQIYSVGGIYWEVDICPTIQQQQIGNPGLCDIRSNIYRISVGPTGFHPTDIRYVQLIVGTEGAVAPLAVFTNNWYWIVTQVNPNIVISPVLLKSDGTPPGPGGTANQPMTGQWLNPPSNANNGGAYGVQCC